jgi:hypothetical protein
MADTKEMQVLLKHLIENPKDLEILQQKPETLLKKLRLKNNDQYVIERVLDLFEKVKPSFDDFIPCPHINFVPPPYRDFPTPYRDIIFPHYIDFIPLPRWPRKPIHCDLLGDFGFDHRIIITKIINILAKSNSDFKAFQINPYALFSEYGIAPNQDLANHIIASVNEIQIELGIIEKPMGTKPSISKKL